MNLENMDKWEELQNVDMAVREVQLSFDKIQSYSDCEEILQYNKYLESLRSLIHEKMKEVENFI